jgi:hypothetical protein
MWAMMPRLESLTVCDDALFCEEGCAFLDFYPCLTELHLHDGILTATAIAVVAQLSQLERLTLGAHVRDGPPDLRQLAGLDRLAYLDLSNMVCNRDEEALVRLPYLPSLREYKCSSQYTTLDIVYSTLYILVSDCTTRSAPRASAATLVVPAPVRVRTMLDERTSEDEWDQRQAPSKGATLEPEIESDPALEAKVAQEDGEGGNAVYQLAFPNLEILWCLNGGSVTCTSRVFADLTKLPRLPRLRDLHLCDHVIDASTFETFVEMRRDCYPHLRQITTREFAMDVRHLPQTLSCRRLRARTSIASWLYSGSVPTMPSTFRIHSSLSTAHRPTSPFQNKALSRSLLLSPYHCHFADTSVILLA